MNNLKITLSDSLANEQTNAAKGLLKTISMTDDTVFNINKYSFIKGDAPDTVHPNLWNQAKLNMNYGLFRVNRIKEDGQEQPDSSGRYTVQKGDVFQIRGFDLANMTIVYDGEGWIVMDCLTVSETAKYAWTSVVQKLLLDVKIKYVVYSHSHIDHYGGTGGLRDFFASDVQILAPDGFLKHAVSENIYAGAAMQRRSLYQYGTKLAINASGQVDAGLGKRVASGTSSIIPPSYEFISDDYKDKQKYIEIDTKTYRKEKAGSDGLTLQFQLTPGTEAPAEMNVYMPEYKVLFIAENCAGTLHNLLTPRGAQVRDPLAWANFLDETLVSFSDLETVCSAHNWPHFTHNDATHFIEVQRDMYRYLNNATLRLINLGYTIDEVGRMIADGDVPLPKDFANEWCCHGFYGTLNHDAKAVYQRYIGWFDGNPSHLNRHKPVDQANRYVNAFGAQNIYNEAKKAADAGDYAWAAELLHYLMNADALWQGDIPNDAKNLYATVLQNTGYQSEAATWRNMYLAGAADIKSYQSGAATPAGTPYMQFSNDTINAMPLEMVLQYFGIMFDGSSFDADGQSAVTMAFETCTPTVDNLQQTEYADAKAARGVLDYRIQDSAATSNPDLMFRGSKIDVFRAFADQDTERLKSVLVSGSYDTACTLVTGYFTRFRTDFPIMTPRPHVQPSLLVTLAIRWGSVIDFLELTFNPAYTCQCGLEWTTPNKSVIRYDPIVKITGVYGVSYAKKTAVSQIVFTSVSGKTYGPFGEWTKGTPFTFEKKGYVINGLFGAFSKGDRRSSSGEPDMYLTRLGVYFTREDVLYYTVASDAVGTTYSDSTTFDFYPKTQV